MSWQQTASIWATQRKDIVKGTWTKACRSPAGCSGRFHWRYTRAFHLFLLWLEADKAETFPLSPLAVPKHYWGFICVSQANRRWRGLPWLSVSWIWEGTDQEVQDKPWCLHPDGSAAGTVQGEGVGLPPSIRSDVSQIIIFLLYYF